jgi:alanyl-tRNA synthetase
MRSHEIRKRFLEFFEKRGHKIIPSASLIPENDPSVLFTTAGMQPLVPYLLGETHPAGTRLVNCQKCFRTTDIDEVGDNTHLTFFEMLGNWSLGDYFKEEAIQWSYELLTSKEEGFGLDPNRLYVTVFEGDRNAPKDKEAAKIWQKYISEDRIYYLLADKNWWPAVKGTDTWSGPTGPCTEMFYDMTSKGLGDLSHEEYVEADDAQNIVEIWNDVFMEYEKKDGKVVGKLAKKNVDTGSGFERVVAVLQGKKNVFDTDLFKPIMNKIEELVPDTNEAFKERELRSKRIVADHLRAAVFLISENVKPGNHDQGYVLRRLLRRAVRHADILNMKADSLFVVSESVIDNYKESYPELDREKERIRREIQAEEERFRLTLEKGMKEFNKIATTSISGSDSFLLFSSYGFPFELIKELADERGLDVDKVGFEEEFKKHQNLSRAGAEQKFKGGLAGTGVMETRYHTATHLLNAALREILGKHVTQKGSNITAERMRFDFTHPEKLTDEQKNKIEDLVNKKIKEGLEVSFKEMPKREAEKLGAIHAFGDKYGDMVKVYSIGNEASGYFSQEFCGGPHVFNTNELGTFKIIKEEAVSAGVRRIKALLE